MERPSSRAGFVLAGTGRVPFPGILLPQSESDFNDRKCANVQVALVKPGERNGAKAVVAAAASLPCSLLGRYGGLPSRVLKSSRSHFLLVSVAALHSERVGVISRSVVQSWALVWVFDSRSFTKFLRYSETQRKHSRWFPNTFKYQPEQLFLQDSPSVNTAQSKDLAFPRLGAGGCALAPPPESGPPGLFFTSI